MLMGSLECVGITTALVKNHGFCFFLPVFGAIVQVVCQELIIIKMYELCTICLEFGIWIAANRIKLTRLMKRHNF